MRENHTEAFEKTRIAGTIAAGALIEAAKIINPIIVMDTPKKSAFLPDIIPAGIGLD